MEYTREGLTDIQDHVTVQRSRQVAVSTGQGQGHLAVCVTGQFRLIFTKVFLFLNRTWFS